MIFVICDGHIQEIAAQTNFMNVSTLTSSRFIASCLLKLWTRPCWCSVLYPVLFIRTHCWSWTDKSLIPPLMPSKSLSFQPPHLPFVSRPKLLYVCFSASLLQTSCVFPLYLVLPAKGHIQESILTPEKLAESPLLPFPPSVSLLRTHPFIITRLAFTSYAVFLNHH